MEFNGNALDPKTAYKLLTAVVVPRPIAWVTTQNAEGETNVAPFSFFNLLGSDPPIVALGISARPGGGSKDTAQNILDTGEFVVNLVDEERAEAMNITAADFPPGESEITAAGLEIVPSVRVAAPRLAASPVQMECRLAEQVTIGSNRVLLGEVIYLHLREDLYDPQTQRIHTEQLHLVGRMHGAGGYVRTTDFFSMPRISYDDWLGQNKKT